MEITELQKLMDEIGNWSDSQFGDNQRDLPILHHLKEEIDELIQAVCTYHEKNSIRNIDDSNYLQLSVLYEFADCLMLLLDAARCLGFNATVLLSYCRGKLEINKKREWGKPDENGVVRHIN